MQIAEYWFDAEDSVNAEKYVNKAAHIMHHVTKRETQVRYKNFQAKISDSKRKFDRAVWEFYGLSNMPEIDPEARNDLLRCAMTCAILQPAGDSKYRSMAVLHKDERSKSIDPHFTVLDKLFMGHIIKWAEVSDFERDHLEDHQKAVDANGQTVLERALLEHNILALSKIYLNISFEQIGKFLDIPADRAEAIISDMVTENRIKAQLDQMTRSVDFVVQVSAKGV